MNNVFVYGTLKKGEPNHYLLNNRDNGSSELLAKGLTIQRYPLVVGSNYNIPFLIDRPGVGNFVEGEVYSVDEKMLARLDVLEDYPAFYDRHIIDIDVGHDKDKISCWVYILKNYPEKLLSLPFITSYKDTEEKRYQESCQSVSDILAKDDL